MALTAKEELDLLRKEKQAEMAFLIDYLIPAHEQITGKSLSSDHPDQQSKGPMTLMGRPHPLGPRP